MFYNQFQRKEESDVYYMKKALRPVQLKVIQKINSPVLLSPPSCRIGYTG